MRKSNKRSNIIGILPISGEVGDLATNLEQCKIDFEPSRNVGQRHSLLALIAHLEQENTALRRKVVDLMLQIHQFRGQKLTRG